MEKKNKENTSSASVQKVFGANSLQITGEDSSRLIGSIVEIGNSGNPNSKLLPPKVTVLPFPVARHRSHGPHWSPVSVKNASDDGDHEDTDPTDFNPISAFANPVQRKQKRDMNLRQWREFIPSDNLLETDKMERNRQRLKKTGKQQKGEVAADNLDEDDKTSMELDKRSLSSVMPITKVRNSVPSDKDSLSFTSADDIEMHDSHQVYVQDHNGVAKVNLEKVDKMDPALTELMSKREQEFSTKVSSSNLNNFDNRQASMSLESEIDAENRARLNSMSSEEIAEAQSEIMEKMNPALLNLLKLRGQKKPKQQNFSSSGTVTNGELYASPTSENQSVKKSNVSSHLGSEDCDMIAKTATDSKSGPNEDSGQYFCPGGGNLWNSWSARVEAVRRLRFSLEGNIITDDAEIGGIHVSERDFLRTDGDPASVGYTIKEAVQLTRSVIPGQRVLALHLLASVLDKAMWNIQQNQVGCCVKSSNLPNKFNDWEAIWAYALGPEPELVLSLRMCLDDNHSSVILACAKVIQSTLSCELNDNFFDISEKISLYEMDIFTGPVFRSKPEMDDGFLHGGFWKYNAKPSNILTFAGDVIDDETEGTNTIQDDIVLAGQDFAAGLVRMGILYRMHYLLEGGPNAALEECIISILVAIARHSPTCANAVMKFPGLVDIIVHKFTAGDTAGIHLSKIRSVTLLKVLAQSEKKNCQEFIQNGSFLAMTRDLFRYTSSLDHWVKSGEENCKLLSALMVEQLRLWRVCISYGFCISYFSDIFPALCLWLNPPTFEKLQENNVLSEFLSVSREAYCVLEALARKLPTFYSQKNSNNKVLDSAGDGLETWSWSFVPPLVDISLKWLALRKDHYVSKYFTRKRGMRNDAVFHGSSGIALLWVFSAVMHLLAALLERVNPEETSSSQGSCRLVPWLPEFVPKIGLAIIENQYLNVNSAEEQEDLDADSTFVGELICLRQQSTDESSLASVSCLHGFLYLITSTDNLISMAKNSISAAQYEVSREGNILEDGLLKRCRVEWTCVLDVFMKLMGSEWSVIQTIETFSRGGPAPGVGLGWGASGGGFWSITALLAQADAALLVYLLEILQVISGTGITTDEEMVTALHRVNSVLQACLIMGPRDRVTMEKALDILFQVPVLNCLNLCVQQYLQSNKRAKPFSWEHKIDDYSFFGEILASHFKHRWLSIKKKSKPTDENSSRGNKSFKKGSVGLDTIHEDSDASNTTRQARNLMSLTQEWAHQRLPLPMHWFLSPITVLSHDKHEVVEITGALFLLLAMEAMSIFLSTDFHSPIKNVPVVRKLHSLSVILVAGMDVLDDSKSRDLYEALQDVYGQLLDEARFTNSATHSSDGSVNLLSEVEKKTSLECLRFQSEIHESYSTFIETLVEEFSSVSYGDMIFGRQVSMYLHRCTEAAVRLSAWKALSNAYVLEILPPLDKCIAEAEGYLEPIEDDEGILEAYVKSWVSGALDRAAARRTMAYTLVLHHLSSFIFLVNPQDKISVRNKLVKSLLRDFSQKQQKHEGMMLELIQYYKPSASVHGETRSSRTSDIEKRFELLEKACDQDSILLAQVEKLRSGFVKNNCV
ncbi:transcriptional elongation regulator MINIYO [Euphorbia lathyris]|uniref:transcriptional elongation regulator MINIYO n=1 Tax=Euphorbia lathyris TaxID=212925 RepID=UPI0033136C9F